MSEWILADNGTYEPSSDENFRFNQLLSPQGVVPGFRSSSSLVQSQISNWREVFFGELRARCIEYYQGFAERAEKPHQRSSYHFNLLIFQYRVGKNKAQMRIYIQNMKLTSRIIST